MDEEAFVESYMKFSVIIPVRNAAVYLRECLDSVKKQKFRDWEAICIDDGSEDESPVILENFSKQDKRFRVFYQQHQGVSTARNTGLVEARGEYVGFIDSDDSVSDNWLKQVADKINTNRPDLVRMNFAYVNADGSAMTKYTQPMENDAILLGKDAITSWAWSTYPFGGWSWLNFIKREVLANSGVRFRKDLPIKEDVIFTLELSRHLEKVVHSSSAGYYYRQRCSSAWHSKRALRCCISFISAITNLYLDSQADITSAKCMNEAKRQVQNAIWQDVLEWLQFGDRNERSKDEALVDVLSAAVAQGIFDSSALATRWKPGLWGIKHLKSMQIVYLTWWLLNVYRRTLRVN